MTAYRGGDLVLVTLADGSTVKGRVLQAPCEWREGRAVTVDCEDGWRRHVDPSRMRRQLVLICGGKDDRKTAR